ncbi:STN and carboxypeptidase regulatory-like domain-containing protein [Spirosoma soli]|uniref:STN and carboxypeptidase regulatory-like domain-containing protein n=1 Tax=Spirosoma soli TaxID=1770529 RepID=A0ABW5ME58_9BACT
MFFHRYLFVCCWWLSGTLVCAAKPTPPLERTINVVITNDRLDKALNAISHEGQFNFSYSPSIINEASIVSLRVANNTVREALNQLFRGTITYKSRGNHVILLRADLPAVDEKPKNFYLDGYILDETNGQKISQASIYEKTTLASAISNPFGYYRIKLPTELSTLRLQVRKENYIGENVNVSSRHSHTLNIRLEPSPLSKQVQPLTIRQSVDTTRRIAVAVQQPVQPVFMASADTTHTPKVSVWDRSKQRLTDWFLSTRSAVHEANLVGDTIYRDVQVSLLPFVGTNGTLSARVINRTSFNVLAGYSLGVTGLEVGGFLNGVRGNANGIQAAGFGNVVGEQVDGVQVAGFANAVRWHVQGVQAAGFANAIGGDVTGVQAAGFANVTLGNVVHGVQAAGFANVTVLNTQGAQLSGFANINAQHVDGAQVGGFFNLAGKGLRGVQVGGFGNVVGGNAVGTQVAGFFNIAQNELAGSQISGFFNTAKRVTKGTQIGLLNFSGYSQHAPIGLLSWVQQNGYRRLEVSTDEVNVINLTFKTGHRAFYNIFTAGTNLENQARPSWSFGYGLGTSANLHHGWMLNFDLVGNYRLPAEWAYFDEGSYLYRFNLGLEKKLTPGLALAVGPTVNWFYSQNDITKPATRFDVPLFTNSVDSRNNFNAGWVGFHAGLRICSRN